MDNTNLATGWYVGPYLRCLVKLVIYVRRPTTSSRVQWYKFRVQPDLRKDTMGISVLNCFIKKCLNYNPIQDLTEIQILETVHAMNFNHLYVQFKTEAKKRTE